MTLADIIQQAPSSETLQLWLRKVPYAAFLGIRAELREGEILFILPEDKRLVGNASLPALHGGVVGAFMEQAGA